MKSFKKILLVDDEESILEIIECGIEDELNDIKIFKAADGLEAYNLCIGIDFDLIITDHRMPYCDGLSYISKIKETENLNTKTPVIFVSAFIPDIEESFAALDDLLYLDKPFDMGRLIKYCKFSINGKNKK